MNDGKQNDDEQEEQSSRSYVFDPYDPDRPRSKKQLAIEKTFGDFGAAAHEHALRRRRRQ